MTIVQYGKTIECVGTYHTIVYYKYMCYIHIMLANHST